MSAAIPWKIVPGRDDSHFEIYSADGQAITGWGSVQQTKDIAEQIVFAVNCHNDLLTACEAVKALCDGPVENTSFRSVGQVRDIVFSAIVQAKSNVFN